jgi:hypothetical protein
VTIVSILWNFTWQCQRTKGIGLLLNQVRIPVLPDFFSRDNPYVTSLFANLYAI